MSDNAWPLYLLIVGGLVALVVGFYLLIGLLNVWPVGLVLVIAGYLIGGASGAAVGLLVSAVFGVVLTLMDG